MQQTDLNIFLQSLRGVQPMIVLAYLLVRNAMTIEQLVTCTGLSDDAIRGAVKSMAAKNLLFKQVGEHGRVTWVPVGGTFFGKIMNQSSLTADSGSQSPLAADSGALIVVNVESEESEYLRATTTTNRVQSPLIADSGGEILSVKTIVKDENDIAACLAVLYEAGIFGKKADEIAEDWHISVEMIKAHLAWGKTEKWDNVNGMVIYRLLNHVPSPPLQENGHIVDCKCSECRNLILTKRYTDNVFSGMINCVDDDGDE